MEINKLILKKYSSLNISNSMFVNLPMDNLDCRVVQILKSISVLRLQVLALVNYEVYITDILFMLYKYYYKPSICASDFMVQW